LNYFLRPQSFVTTADTLFNQQDKFQTDATVNTTQAELFEDIFAPMAVSLGVEKSKFLAHMNNDDASNSQARVAWKFGAARGVTGTPTFSANGNSEVLSRIYADICFS
jgi:hypothetical protein